MRWADVLGVAVGQGTVLKPEVAGLILDGTDGIFHRLNNSGLSLALGSIQRLKEMSAKDISWSVKVVGP